MAEEKKEPQERQARIIAVVAEFERRGNTQLRITAEEFNGARYLQIREWWRRDEADEWKPSRKGITIPHRLLGEMPAAMKKGLDALDADAPSGGKPAAKADKADKPDEPPF